MVGILATTKITNKYFKTKEQPQDIYKDDEYPLDCSEVQLDPAWRSTGVGGEQSQSDGRISFLSCKTFFNSKASSQNGRRKACGKRF